MKIILFILAFLFLLPVLSVTGMSFLSDSLQLTLGQYDDLLFNCFMFYPMFWNSVGYAVVITALQCLIIIPCAFGFHHGSFRGKRILALVYFVLMMMPLQVTILPNYIGLRDMSILNTRWGIILPAIFSPFGVVVMKQYMKGMEDSVIEAARLETSSIIKIILHILVPQLKTCIFAVVLFVCADSYNMLEQPMLFLQDDQLSTLTVFLANTQAYVGDVLFPAAVIFMIPIVILYGFFSNHLEQGLTLGDVL